MRVRRGAVALGASAAMVVVIAALVPRGYLANDDVALTEFLRKNMFTPWISPVLARALGFAYQQSLTIPWFGLYQYAVIVATGAALIHLCSELVDRRPGFGGLASWLGAIVIGASHAILVIGITWTTVSICAIGTAVGAFIAHAQNCQAAVTPVSRSRALVYGLLLVSGFALRPDGLSASGVALLPMLGWAALRFARSRYLPSLGAVIALLAPTVLLVAIQHVIPPARGGETNDYAEWNLARGQLTDQAAYAALDQRAPQLLERAGWTVGEYRDFGSWLFVDENDFPTAKLQRLIDTGGVPASFSWEASELELRAVFYDSAASVLTFGTIAVICIALSWLGMIKRGRGLAFSLGYVAWLVAVPLAMSAYYRFPQRVSLPLYAVAALGLFIYLARQVADRPPEQAAWPKRGPRATIAVVAIAVFAFGWARHLIGWFGQLPRPYREELQAIEDRVAARNAFIFVYIQVGLVEFDPLRAEPRHGYEGLQGGWASFSAPWYDAIARLGVRRGSDVFAAMLDNPDAYLLAPRDGTDYLEDWIRRKLRNSRVRLAFVDSAVYAKKDRPVLYRLVTRPLERGDDEWQAQQRDEWLMNNTFPGPPSVTGLTFRPFSFAAPYEQHLSPLRHAAPATISPVEGGLRCTAAADQDSACIVAGANGLDAGVHLSVNGLCAARFEVSLIEPEHIVSFNAYARTRTSSSTRWRWDLAPEAQKLGFAGTFTLLPGYPANRLVLAIDTARPEHIRDLDIFVTIKPGTHAGFELRRLEVAEASSGSCAP